MSEIIINEKTHIELPVYLSIEHNILRNREYKRCFEYIEELINRNVKFASIYTIIEWVFIHFLI